MNWEEVHRLCLEKRLEDEEKLKVALLVDLELQNKMIEGVKAELEKLTKKKHNKNVRVAN